MNTEKVMHLQEMLASNKITRNAKKIIPYLDGINSGYSESDLEYINDLDGKISVVFDYFEDGYLQVAIGPSADNEGIHDGYEMCKYLTGLFETFKNEYITGVDEIEFCVFENTHHFYIGDDVTDPDTHLQILNAIIAHLKTGPVKVGNVNLGDPSNVKDSHQKKVEINSNNKQQNPITTMNPSTRDIQLTSEELNFLAESMAWVINSSEGFDDVAAMAYKLGLDFQRAIDDINYGHMRVDRKDNVQNNTTTKDVGVTEPPITVTQLTMIDEKNDDPVVVYYTSDGNVIYDSRRRNPDTKNNRNDVMKNQSANAPISITQLTTIDETIDDPIVIYYTAEGKLDPYEEDKREVFICVESKEQSALGIWGKYLDMSQYDRQVISQRGEYKIVPGGDTDGLVNVNFIGSDELHEFTDGIMLVTRAEVKDEAIETWFPQSNNGRYRDYSPDSIDDITQFNGPDSPIGEPNQLTDAQFEAEYVIYIYA